MKFLPTFTIYATALAMLLVTITYQHAGPVPTQPIAIIFDLGGVVINVPKRIFGISIDVQKVAVVKEMGIKNILHYALFAHKNPFSLQKALFDLLNKVDPSSINLTGISDNKGIVLPGLMYEWQVGTKTGSQVIALTQQYLRAHKDEYKKTERVLMRRLMNAIFDAQTFASSCELCQETIDYIKQYKDAGYRIGILSNWDTESFALVYDANQDFFELFEPENIFISSHVGLTKPDPAIYQHVLHCIGQPCLFVDDQIENVKAARAAGMYAVQFTGATSLKNLVDTKLRRVKKRLQCA